MNLLNISPIGKVSAHLDALNEVIDAWQAQGARLLLWTSPKNAGWKIKFAPRDIYERDWVGRCLRSKKEIILNQDKHWTTHPQFWKFWRKQQIDIRQVLAHEIGHALGLEHSENPASIMDEYRAYAGKWRGISEVDRIAPQQPANR